MKNTNTFITVLLFLTKLYLFPTIITAANPPESGTLNLKPETSLKGSGLMFTQNKGQIVDMAKHLRPDVLFKGEGGGADIYLRKTGVSYVLSNMTEVMHKIEEQVEDMIKAGEITHEQKQEKKNELEQKAFLKVHRVDVDFVGGNADPETISADPVEGYHNYYYAHCPQGITHVNSYNEVIQKNIYPGIDVKYFGGKEKGLKYDIIVNPGADPSQIRLKYSGAKEIVLENEKLNIETFVGRLGEYIPKVYQDLNGKIVEVKAEYILTSISKGEKEESESLVTFKLGNYNPEYSLIIDPWATYYGGTWNEWGLAITTDPFGNVLFTGASGSSDFPLTAGAFQTILSNFNVFAVKMDSNGNRLWATFIGGNNQQQGTGIAADAVGNVYVTGYTYSLDFPTGASAGNFVHQNVYGGGTADVFLSKFDPAGTRLWITYYGGSNTDYNPDVATDGNNVYLYGNTPSSNAIATPGVFQANLNAASTDVFLVKFAANGIRIWGTYVGGAGTETPGGITCDQSGNIYISGGTSSVNFPVGALAPNVVFQSAAAGGFLFKFDPSGTRLWATYFGGMAASNDVAVDNSGNVIMTASNGLMKFNSIGNQKWVVVNPIPGLSAYVRSLAIDNTDNIYIYGEWEDRNPGIVMSPCAYQPNFGDAGTPGGDGPEDEFIAKYDPNGVQHCLTYVGGKNEDDLDYGGSVITIKGNFIYITGMTFGTGYPVTAGAFQTVFGGGSLDVFVNKLCINICEAKVLALNLSANATNICVNKPVTFTPSLNVACDTSGMRFRWTFAGGNPSSSTSPIPVITFPSPGSYSVKLVLTSACKNDSVTKPSFITVSSCSCTLSAATTVVSNVTCSSSGSANVTISNASGGSYTYNWSNGSSSITSSNVNTISGLSEGTYSVTVTDGSCIAITSVSLTQSLIVNSISHSDLLCAGGNNGSATISVSGGAGNYSYSWSNAISTISSSNSHSIANLKAGTYTVTVQNGTCVSTSSVTIAEPDPILVAFSNLVSCSSTIGTSTATPVNGSPPYTYLWSNGQTSQTASGLIGGNTYTITVKDKDNCSVIQTDYVIIPTRISLGGSGTTNVSCTTSGYAYINFTGVPPMTYVWSTGKSGVVNIQSGFTNLIPPAGNYTITITDGYGCSATKAFTITGTSPVSAAFLTPPTLCMGVNACFTNTGSTGTYTWTIAAPVSVSGTSTNFCYTFLTAGTYSVNHTVANAGCTNTIEKQVVVLNCSGPTITATGSSVCPGSCAAITTVPAGGTAPYTYLWSNGATAQNINPCPVTTTTYTVTIKDTGGNTSTSSAVVTINPTVNATTIPSNINCSGGTGSITAAGAGGSAPYVYNWSASGGSGSTVTGLTAGNYTVTVTDSKGCTGTSTASIISPLPLAGQFTKGTANCVGCSCKEWLMLTATGGTNPYSYSWPGGYTNRYKNQLCPGTYLINITDKNGCSVNVSFTSP